MIMRGGRQARASDKTSSFQGWQQSTLLAPSFEDEDKMRIGERMNGKGRKSAFLIRSQNAAAELRSR